MNTVVLIKQVPDTATRIQDRVKNGQLDLEGVTWITNPYDEYAVEEALRVKEARGGTVTLVSVGPERVQTALKDMLALGADEAVHVWDPSFASLDARGIAAVLVAALGKLDYEVIWTGWKGVDDDQGLLPIYLAHALGLPHASLVVGAEFNDGRVTIRREVEGGKEVLDLTLPAVLMAQKGLNEPRYASLKGIMAVKRKLIPTWDAAALGLDPASLPAPTVELLSLERPPDRPPGRKLTGSPDETAGELVRLLHQEAKVI